MKIKETIERDCCQPRDLKKYAGKDASLHPGRGRQFCVHCGQQFEWVRHPGELDGGMEPCVADVSLTITN